MKLNLEQIKSITVGSLSVIECDGYYRFFKCTEKQMRAWYEHGSETLGDRARTTSGVRLDFHTNSNNFAFRITGRKAEVLIDGMQRGIFFPGEDGIINGEIALTDMIGNGKEDVRVTLVFSSHGLGD